MPRKKNKGRGRGRGRGQSGEHGEQQQVGQKAVLQEESGASSDPRTPESNIGNGLAGIGQTTGLPAPQNNEPIHTHSPGQHGTSNKQSRQFDSALPEEPIKFQTSGNDVPPKEQRSKQVQSLPPQRQQESSEGHRIPPQEPQTQRRMPLQENIPPKGQTEARKDQKSSPKCKNGRDVSKQVMMASSMTDDKLRQHQEVALLPRRPGFGKEGRPIRLKANFFRLDFRKVDYIFHYDIDIKPDKAPTSECRDVVNSAINRFLKTTFEGHRPAFDGRKNLYSRKKLQSVNGDGVTLDITLPGIDGGKDRHFKLTIKFAAQVCVADLQQFLDGNFNGKMPQEAVQALDIVLRQIPSFYFTPIGRSFFPHSSGGENLGGGCEILAGFYQSIRPSQWKTMLVNVDVSSKGFQKHQPVIDLLLELFPNIRGQDLADKRWQMEPRMNRDFVKAIKGLKIETNHIPGIKRKYVVVDLGKSASTHVFDFKDEGATQPRQISVEQYFGMQYQIRLQYPHLPCLVVGQKKNCLPMEVCSMVPCAKRKLTDQQTAEMIKKTARPAYERQKKIEEWAHKLEYESRNYLGSEFGMSINKSMVDVDGRVLPAPKVEMGERGTIIPSNGAWDMRGKKFFRGADVRVWAMVCFENPRKCDEKVTQNFASQMARTSSNEGMRMNNRPCKIQYARPNDNIEQLLSNLVINNQDMELILVVLPSQGHKEIYKEVKRVGDTVLGIATQCVQTKQFMTAKPQVCSNIAMKINAKLGGTNHIVDPSMMPEVFKEVIVFGADVTHPSPGENNIPSIAAVVASMDSHASRYAARVRAQVHVKDKAAQEIILEMAAMVRELLVEFYKQTRIKPKRIIFYRDGVSEGQFDQVLTNEVKAVQQACLNIQKDGQYQPPITFIVVQKRHHARFFCADRNDQCGKSGNVPAGTTVDSGITHPFEFDFYLCSHQGIQGTSRPTHYHVLYDDNNFKADGLQKLTYHLCHTYARCTRSVSMPSPAYYAHLVAFRARHHLNSIVATRRDDRKSEEEIMKEFSKAINVDDKVKSGMYFA